MWSECDERAFFFAFPTDLDQAEEGSGNLDPLGTLTHAEALLPGFSVRMWRSEAVSDLMPWLSADAGKSKQMVAVSILYGLDKQLLGELIATIELTAASEGEKTHRFVDLLGRVYEYFLTGFASAEGKHGGQFYTPSCVVRCLVEMLAPYKGRIYDPCCGSGGMFVQSAKIVESHGGTGQRDSAFSKSEATFPGLKGNGGDISIYGQGSNATTRRLAVMNLALRGIEADLGHEHADTFRRDLHPDLRADYVLANPPFNDSDRFRKDDDVRWQFGVPPKGNANFAWVQHFIHHLAPQGMAGFVLANGSMCSNQSGEGDILRALIETDIVPCVTPTLKRLRRKVRKPCLPFEQENLSALCEK